MIEYEIVKKHTIAPLFAFEGDFTEDIELGSNCFISRLPDNLLDNYLGYGELWDEEGKTSIINASEKRRFVTKYCIDHRYEGPKSPHLANEEEESKDIVIKIIQAIQLIKFARVSPEFIIQTQGEDYAVVNATNMNEQSYVPAVPWAEHQQFTSEDIRKIKILWPNIRKVYAKHQSKFNRIANALSFFRSGLGLYAGQWRFIAFVVALESVYSLTNMEVSYSLSQRLAWFLGDGAKERLDYFKDAKKIYDIRSRIIHGDTIKENLLDEVNDLMAKLEHMARLSLAKIISEDSLIDIFSNTEKLKDYFDNLTLHNYRQRGDVPESET